jgi:catechol 2,3-dioxygenase-like lactoylglutathione lyase family enzyme
MEGKMILGMDHTGFVVRDVEKSSRFYQDVIGLEVVRTADRDGGPISQVVGYENTHLKVVLLNMGNGHTLELIQYIRPAGAERPTEERNVLGASHIAFRVDDIEGTFRHLVKSGMQKLNPPVEIAPGRKGCYLQDPDGNWVEIIEVIE